MQLLQCGVTGRICSLSIISFHWSVHAAKKSCHTGRFYSRYQISARVLVKSQVTQLYRATSVIIRLPSIVLIRSTKNHNIHCCRESSHVSHYLPVSIITSSQFVGTPKDGYLRKVPLPRVPLRQSTEHVTASAVTRVPRGTCYLQVPRVPTWGDLIKSLFGDLGSRML